ncbi:hypothetical protein [Methylobacter tundripaludum]|uniref:hypothetical protein n=1 Tax=Methylobacter tundripaludum TaxID=173365 RepID=UPI0004DF5458|nr:hypothetical protein [Methylobacter tundripaludum]
MNSSHSLIQETQKLHRQLALIADAVVGHFETYGSNKEDVYTIAIYEQMTQNTKMAGSLVDRLSSLDNPEAAQSKVMKKR